MFLREVEHDPFTGITKKWYFDGDKIICHKEWDEDPFVASCLRQKNETIDSTFINSKRRVHKMASLPPIVVEKLLHEHGINVMQDLSPAETKKLYRLIESDFGFCKTHTKKLWRPKGSVNGIK